MSSIVTAAILMIGNELLSGRTKDANLSFLAEGLGEIGIQVMEARVVRDVESAVVEALNELRARYDYVFTTGGIGPTHDDITTSCVARAFGVKVIRHPEAERLLREYYQDKINDARLRMADVPEGATLIDNPVSLAPGFRIGNVHVMAGVPSICRAMFGSVKQSLRGGVPVESVTLSGWVGEGQIATELGAIQERFSQVEIGSYPFFRDGRVGTSLVLRSAEKEPLRQAVQATQELLNRHHVEPAA